MIDSTREPDLVRLLSDLEARLCSGASYGFGRGVYVVGSGSYRGEEHEWWRFVGGYCGVCHGFGWGFVCC